MSKLPSDAITPESSSVETLVFVESVADGSDRVQGKQLEHSSGCRQLMAEPRGGSARRTVEQESRRFERVDARGLTAQTAPSVPGKEIPEGYETHQGAGSSLPGQGYERSAVARAPFRGTCHGRQSRGSSQRNFVPANHLLGFKYDEDRQRRGRGGRAAHHSRKTAGYVQPFNKDQFLQANYRFLVSDAVDTDTFSKEPDRMFQWEDVVQVEMLVTAPMKCPISLDCPPICPQLTPCGHVFGFPSIMQHLMVYGGPQLRAAAPCPLCFTKIAARELRLVVTHEVQAPRLGDTIKFQLLKRPKNLIIPEVVRPMDDNSVAPGRCHRFTKFTTIAEPMDLWLRAARELAEHVAEVVAQGGSEAQHEAQAVYAALDELAARAGAWTACRAGKLTPHLAGQADAVLPEKAGCLAEAKIKEVFTAKVAETNSSLFQQEARAAFDQKFPKLPAKEAQHSAQEVTTPAKQKGTVTTAEPDHDQDVNQNSQLLLSCSSASATCTKEDEVSEALSKNFRPHEPPKDYYFYQSIDGQPLFLHPVNVKCLLYKYGMYAACPAILEGEIVELEDVLQNEGSRKRYKNLAHLPSQGMFKFVEIDLSSLLAPDCLKPIMAREERRRKRETRQKEEDAHKKAVARAAEIAARPPSLQELKSMPKPFQPVDAASSESANEEEDEWVGHQEGGVSFAQVTKMGIAASWGAAASGSSPVDARFPALSPSATASLIVGPPKTWDHKPHMGGLKIEASKGLAHSQPLPGAKSRSPPMTQPLAPGVATANAVPGKKTKKGTKTVLFSISQKRGQ